MVRIGLERIGENIALYRGIHLPEVALAIVVVLLRHVEYERLGVGVVRVRYVRNQLYRYPPLIWVFSENAA